MDTIDDFMNQGWVYCDRIQKDAAGETVLAYYTRRYRHSSEAEWQGRIERSQITLNGRSVRAEDCVRAGQELRYYRSPWQEPDAPLDFDVLYEDDDLWVINKPSGLPVLPGGGFLEHTLLHQLQKRYPNHQPIPVHRLGRGTSGAMLIAKSQVARVQLSRQFRRRTAERDHAESLMKVYRALIGPTSLTTLPQRFACEYAIGKVAHDRLGYVFGAVAGGNIARSEVTVLERRVDTTLVEVAIKTGRQHQIRIHLAAAGFPLLGDPLYVVGGVAMADGLANPGDCGYCLHAYRLGFEHPTRGDVLCVEAPLPNVLTYGG